MIMRMCMDVDVWVGTSPPPSPSLPLYPLVRKGVGVEVSGYETRGGGGGVQTSVIERDRGRMRVHLHGPTSPAYPCLLTHGWAGGGYPPSPSTLSPSPRFHACPYAFGVRGSGFMHVWFEVGPTSLVL